MLKSSVTDNGKGAFMAINGDSIYCDCCGTEKLAEIVGANLVIKDRRHGEKHLAVVPIQSLIDKLAKEGYILINNNLQSGAAAARKGKSEIPSAAPAIV
jgi:hypothetical protein